MTSSRLKSLFRFTSMSTNINDDPAYLKMNIIITNDFLKHKQENIKVDSRGFGVNNARSPSDGLLIMQRFGLYTRTI